MNPLKIHGFVSPVLSLLLVWRPGEALPGLGWPRGIRVGRWGPEALVISILPGRARPGLSGALLSLGPALGGGGRGQGRPAAWCPESSGAALSVDGRHPDCLRPPWDGCVYLLSGRVFLFNKHNYTVPEGMANPI